MSDIAIRVKNLSKRYRIGLKEELHDTFAGALSSFVRSPVKNLKKLRQLSHFEEEGNDPEDVIWALKDVSFEVKRGEILGIIGRNGAGKSTLLKILSKITYPSTGRVELNGRVASLLEVGTGFHSELTGRENIYLNGAILGMTKNEIDRKFDEIVDFSGVEKFIDTPVKRYSSGMRVRLAFSVAAHLEPENLLIDEVLAVGDADFQRKCLGKMENIVGAGRTVLFVSHNMSAIRNLCKRGLYLERGYIAFAGNIDQTIATYLNTGTNHEQSSKNEFATCGMSFGPVLINGRSSREIKSGKPVILSVPIILNRPTSRVRLNCILYNMRGMKVIHIQITNKELNINQLGLGKHVISIHIPSLWLATGIYTLVFKALKMDDPSCERPIESDYLPLFVDGRVSKFGTDLVPSVHWEISSTNPE